MLSLIFGFIGLLAGGLINVLADDLPARVRPQLPHCPDCNHQHGILGWLAVGRLLFQHRKCPECGLPTRPRAWIVELVTMVVFGAMPFLIKDIPNLYIDTFYIAVLILVIVIDFEHRLILHIVTFPTTLLAILLSNFQYGENNFILSLSGAAIGFLFFYVLYWIGYVMYGPGALGFGDVTLSMTMGAMLGALLIVFTLILAILIGAVTAAGILLVYGRARRIYIPYGQFLAVAAMIMLIWGQQIVSWYLGI